MSLVGRGNTPGMLCSAVLALSFDDQLGAALRVDLYSSAGADRNDHLIGDRLTGLFDASSMSAVETR